MKLAWPKFKMGMLILAAVFAATLTAASTVVRVWQCQTYFTSANTAGSDLEEQVCNDEQFERLLAQASVYGLPTADLKPNVRQGFPLSMMQGGQLQLTSLPALLGNLMFYFLIVVLFWYILTLIGILDPSTFAG